MIVVGAGYAGLAAADRALALGLKPLIVEARDRVGGRTLTRKLDSGVWVDLGGQWIGPGQENMYQLAKRFDHGVWPMYAAGRQVVEVGNKVKTYRGLIPLNLPPLVLANLLWGFARIEWQARWVHCENPSQARRAAQLDQRTMGDWLRSNIRNQTARKLMQVAIEAVFAAHPDDIGLLHALAYINAGGGFERLTSSSGGAQQDRVAGGMQGLAESYCQDLERRDVAIHRKSPVDAIVQSADHVEVRVSSQIFRARHAIVTLPPAIAAEIDFWPAMSEERKAWCRSMIPGRVIKGFAIYNQPFWRKSKLCGQAASDRGPVHLAFDATPPESIQGVLLGFIEGREALEWSGRGLEARREVMLNAFTRFFGSQAASPIEYVDHDWTVESFSRGCYAGVPGPGVTCSVARTSRIPHGKVHWAGTETAIHWTGYIEGAVRSGIRAAEELLRV